MEILSKVLPFNKKKAFFVSVIDINKYSFGYKTKK